MVYSEIDKCFLQQLGGVENNSFVNIINSDLVENEDNNEPTLISHSSYYDYDNLISTLKKNKNQFSILSTNIQSICSKIDELRIFIEMLKISHLEFSAICIQESWLAEGADLSQLQLEGYSCIPQGYSCTSKGGLIIYLNTKFQYIDVMKLTGYNTWGGQVIQVRKGEHLAKPVIIGNIYRPPRDLIENYKEFIDEFTPILN